MPDGEGNRALEKFAEANRLRYGSSAELPRRGIVLGRDDLKVGGAATGKLPGGEEGTLAQVTYVTKSNDSTETHRLTLVAVRLPETIGYAPYLASGTKPRSVGDQVTEIAEGVNVTTADGVSAGWLRELFSPALTEWVARSPEGFAFELSEGVLRVSREGHLGGTRELTTLCEDAAHLAGALRSEVAEETSSGAVAGPGRREQAKRRRVEASLSEVRFEEPPAHIAEARGAYRRALARKPGTYVKGILLGVLFALGVNVIGGGIFGLLLNLPDPGLAVIIFEIIVLAFTIPSAIRRVIENGASACGKEAFYRSYAASHRLKLEEALPFAARNPQAELPGKPDVVMSGELRAGVEGSLALAGEGLKRDDWVAVVVGGAPARSAELKAEASGVSARLLDGYIERLTA